METCESEKSYSSVLECSHQKFKCTKIIRIWKLTSNKHFHVLNARSVKFHKNPAVQVALRNCVNVSYTTDSFCIWTRRTRSIYVNHKNPRTRTRRNTAVSMEEPPLPMTSLLESALFFGSSHFGSSLRAWAKAAARSGTLGHGEGGDLFFILGARRSAKLSCKLPGCDGLPFTNGSWSGACCAPRFGRVG